MESKKYNCPICRSNDLVLKHEASYVYSYVVDSDAPGLKNSEVFSSFLYDSREQKDSVEYVECSRCGTRYPCGFLKDVLEQDHQCPDFVI